MEALELFGEAVEGLAVLVREALGEGVILGPPGDVRIARQARAEGTHVLVVKGVALAQVVRHLADKILGDLVCAHPGESTPDV